MSDAGSASLPVTASGTAFASASSSSPTGAAASPAPALATPVTATPATLSLATATPASVSPATVSTATIAVHGNGSTLPGWGFLFLAVLFLVAVAAALPATVRRTRLGAHRRGRH